MGLGRQEVGLLAGSPIKQPRKRPFDEIEVAETDESGNEAAFEWCERKIRRISDDDEKQHSSFKCSSEAETELTDSTCASDGGDSSGSDSSPEPKSLTKREARREEMWKIFDELEAKLSEHQAEKVQLDASVKPALEIFDELWVKFVTNQEKVGGPKASEMAEQEVADLYYQKACDVCMSLVPWLAGRRTSEKTYDVIEFEGAALTLPKKFKHADVEHFDDVEEKLIMEKKLGNFRESSHGRARDALMAILAVLGCRPEMAWLEAFDAADECALRRAEYPKETKKVAWAKTLDALTAINVRGYFADALVHRASVIRVAFTRGPTPRPASFILTYLLPFKKALEKMDDDGPIVKQTRKHCRRQYALQDIVHGEKEGTRTERVAAQTLQPDPRLQALMRSKEPVVMMDVVSALAPRGAARDHGLSKIVKAELCRLLAESKARGQTVLFLVGGEEPHLLAEKVYLKAPFTDGGLRCGYLRWRETANEAWAREKGHYDGRGCLGIQFP